jgi:AbiV family abortive infection protein
MFATNLSKNKMDKTEYLNGINKTLANAIALYEDAEILLKNERYSRAYTLYQLSIEEVGKIILIYNFLIYQNIQDISEQKKIKREFTNHKSKTQHSIGLDILLAFLISDQELKKKILYQVHKQQNELEQLNLLKNSSLYTDIKNGKFIQPQEIITEKLTTDIKFIAEVRLNLAKGFFKIAIENFEQVSETVQNINEDEIIKNPPPELIELANFKIEEMINSKQLIRTLKN